MSAARIAARRLSTLIASIVLFALTQNGPDHSKPAAAIIITYSRSPRGQDGLRGRQSEAARPPPAAGGPHAANGNGKRSMNRTGPRYSPLVTLPFLAGLSSNLLFLGKPLGAKRPASARLPRQSANSLRDSVKTRPAESVQVNPFSASNTLMSDSPPSLWRCSRTPRPRA